MFNRDRMVIFDPDDLYRYYIDHLSSFIDSTSLGYQKYHQIFPDLEGLDFYKWIRIFEFSTKFQGDFSLESVKKEFLSILSGEDYFIFIQMLFASIAPDISGLKITKIPIKQALTKNLKLVSSRLLNLAAQIQSDVKRDSEITLFLNSIEAILGSKKLFYSGNYSKAYTDFKKYLKAKILDPNILEKLDAINLEGQLLTRIIQFAFKDMHRIYRKIYRGMFEFNTIKYHVGTKYDSQYISISMLDSDPNEFIASIDNKPILHSIDYKKLQKRKASDNKLSIIRASAPKKQYLMQEFRFFTFTLKHQNYPICIEDPAPDINQPIEISIKYQSDGSWIAYYNGREVVNSRSFGRNGEELTYNQALNSDLAIDVAGVKFPITEKLMDNHWIKLTSGEKKILVGKILHITYYNCNAIGKCEDTIYFDLSRYISHDSQMTKYIQPAPMTPVIRRKITKTGLLTINKKKIGVKRIGLKSSTKVSIRCYDLDSKFMNFEIIDDKNRYHSFDIYMMPYIKFPYLNDYNVVFLFKHKKYLFKNSDFYWKKPIFFEPISKNKLKIYDFLEKRLLDTIQIDDILNQEFIDAFPKDLFFANRLTQREIRINEEIQQENKKKRKENSLMFTSPEFRHKMKLQRLSTAPYMKNVGKRKRIRINNQLFSVGAFGIPENADVEITHRDVSGPYLDFTFQYQDHTYKSFDIYRKNYIKFVCLERNKVVIYIKGRQSVEDLRLYLNIPLFYWPKTPTKIEIYVLETKEKIKTLHLPAGIAQKFVDFFPEAVFFAEDKHECFELVKN